MPLAASSAHTYRLWIVKDRVAQHPRLVLLRRCVLRCCSSSREARLCSPSYTSSTGF